MVVKRLVRKLEERLRGRDILHYVTLPSLAVVDNLEVAEELKRKYSPTEVVVVHSPEYLSTVGSRPFNLGDKKVFGYFLDGKRFSRAMAKLYENRAQETENHESLQSLEDAISRQTRKREDNQAFLREVAQAFGKDGSQDPVQVRQLVHNLLTSQFEYPEHFIRELIQNSAAAAPDPKVGRIDVYLDQENHVVKVSDNGIGMTQDVMENVYFNLYKSLNEALAHAAGKFGIGAVSIFGLKHDYVKVDSRPESGLDGMAVVDSDLMRGDFLPTTRNEKGTTVEIKLTPDSDVSFERIVNILKQDCSYIETPIYLHVDGASQKINKPLDPNLPETITFSDGRVQGYLTRKDRGILDILSHRIRLSSLEIEGYEGAVNCNDLDTTFSRDTVVDDPVLRYVLTYIRQKSRELKHDGALDISNLSVDARLADYGKFIRSKIFKKDGTPNNEWISQNLDAIVGASHEYHHEEPQESLVLDLLMGANKIYGYITLPVLKALLIASRPVLKPLLKNVKRRDSSNEVKPLTKEDWDILYQAPGIIAAVGTGVAAFGLAVYGDVTGNRKLGDNGMRIFLAEMLAGLGIVGLCKIEEGIRGAYKGTMSRIDKRMVKKRAEKSIGVYHPASRDTGSHVLGYSLGMLGTGLALFGISRGLSWISENSSSGLSQEAREISDISSKVAEVASKPEVVSNIVNTAQQQEPNALPYVVAATAVSAGLLYLLHRYRKNKLFAQYDGTLLTKDQQEFLENVRGELQQFGNVKVYYGKNLAESHPRFLVRPGKVVINMNTKYPAWAPALGYAANVLKSVDAANQISRKHLVERK